MFGSCYNSHIMLTVRKITMGHGSDSSGKFSTTLIITLFVTSAVGIIKYWKVFISIAKRKYNFAWLVISLVIHNTGAALIKTTVYKRLISLPVGITICENTLSKQSAHYVCINMLTAVGALWPGYHILFTCNYRTIYPFRFVAWRLQNDFVPANYR